MKNIDKIVKEEIRKTRNNRLNENFQKLSLIKDDNSFFESYFRISSELIEDGYSIDEIGLMTEQNLIDRITSGGAAMAKDAIQKGDLVGGAQNAFLSTIKEQIIRWILSMLGVGKGLANYIAPMLAVFDPRRLLLLFKSEQDYYNTMPDVVDAILNGMIRHMQFGDQDVSIKGDLGKLATGNVMAEIIKQSTLGEIITEKLAGIIWHK